MYVYLYDNFVRDKEHEETLKAIETKLTDYGIAGKIVRLQNFTNPQSIINEEVRKGARTAVVVGNDDTIGRVLSLAASCNITFGFLPVGKDIEIADVLGIPSDARACDVLAQRRKIKLDVGWFNNRYFISQLHIPPSNIRIEYDEKFSVRSDSGLLELVVCNLKPFHWTKEGRDQVVHPQDGKLEAFLRPVQPKKFMRRLKFEDPSLFPFEEMTVSSKTPFSVEANGKKSKETKITIRLAKKRIQMIVGKRRKF